MDYIDVIEGKLVSAFIVPDMDAYSVNPRDHDTPSIMAFADNVHRQYGAGDQGTHMNGWKTCDACEGDGYAARDSLGGHGMCAKCEGDGELEISVMESLRRAGAVVLPLRYSDYGSSGSQVYVSDDDDANGYIWVDGSAVEREWNGDREAAERYLTIEVEEYSRWLSGEVYGVVVTENDEDGEPDEHGADVTSCFGFIGWEYARGDAAREMLADGEAIVAQERDEARHWAERDTVTI